MGIVEFLEARIAEDEAVAKNVASAGEWTSGSTYGMFVSVEARCGTVVSGEWERQDANHIARHDPARILHEVAAKRELVASEGFGRCQGHPKPWMRHGEYGAGFCFTPPEGSALYVLAAIYSDHPDFNEEWRP